MFTEQCQATFTDLREMEEETVNEISTAAMLYIDSVAKGEADGMVELSDEALEVMRDKTALSTAIASAHDNHLMEIDNKEDDILGLAKKEVAALMDRLHADEVCVGVCVCVCVCACVCACLSVSVCVSV